MRDDHLTLRYDIEQDDPAVVRRLCVAAGNFSPDEIEVAGSLAEERLKTGKASGYFFVFAQMNDTLAGYACYGPIPCTRESWDLYWIVVDPVFQGRGIGKKLLTATQNAVLEANGARIYIETSSRSSYQKTRDFYRACGYRVEARLADFYAPNDDKFIFMRLL